MLADHTYSERRPGAAAVMNPSSSVARLISRKKWRRYALLGIRDPTRGSRGVFVDLCLVNYPVSGVLHWVANNSSWDGKPEIHLAREIK
jgi:hypothetical protein